MPDHNDRLELMIDEVLLHWETTSGHGPFPVWKQLTAELLAHVDAEEKWLLPQFALAHPDEARVIRANHTELRAQLIRVDRELALKTRSATALLALQKVLRAHAQREDRVLHPWAVEHLDAEAWKAVRTAMRTLMFNVSSSHEREES